MANAPVLYVEDEDNDVLFMGLAFERVGVGHPLKVVSDGQQAIDYLAGKAPFANRQEHPLPSLVLLDLNLPRKSGMEVLQWIRQQPQFQELPVVICSSSGHERDVEKAMQLGANDYLVKQAHQSETARQVQALKNRWLMTNSAGG